MGVAMVAAPGSSVGSGTKKRSSEDSKMADSVVIVTPRGSDVLSGLSASVKLPHSTSDPLNVEVHDTSVGPVCNPFE